MMGTKNQQKLARKKAKMDQIRKGKALSFIKKMSNLLISPDRLYWTQYSWLNLSIRRWGKRARAFRDKKERLLIFRGHMNSNKERILIKEPCFYFIKLKNLRGMWGKRSGENHYLRQPDSSEGLWRNWRSEYIYIQHSTFKARANFFKTFWKFLTRSGGLNSLGSV